MDFEIPKTEFVFEARVECSQPQPIGQTPEGNAIMVPIVGGTVEGPQIKATVLPGGADWPVSRGDGVTVIDARYAIRTDDGVIITVHNRGLAVRGSGTPYIRTVPQFIAPEGRYSWLNQAIFVGTLEARPGAPVTVRVFRVV